jgi:tetratricopeptide (TPR) repeat protein
LKTENRYEEALKCFRARAKIVQTPEAGAQVAEILYLCERDEAALASYRDVLKNVVTDTTLLFDIYKNVGNIHTRAGDFEAAEEFYDKAYTLRPRSDVLLVNYGTLEIQRGAWNEAVTRFRSAVEINPQSDRGWVGLAMVHHSMGDFELAKANLQRALDINGANRTALKLAVDWAQADHQFGFAIEHLQNYLGTKGSEDAEISFLLARTLVQAGQFRHARLEIERVLALDPAFESADSLARALDRHLAASASSAPSQVNA